MEKSKFLKVKCPRCKNNQLTYGRATLWVKCKTCNKLLIRPKGGKAKVKAPVRKVLNPLDKIDWKNKEWQTTKKTM